MTDTVYSADIGIEDGVIEHSSEAAILGAHSLIIQLRPQLISPDLWLAAFKRQAESGYRVLLSVQDGKPRGLAGFRLQENLIHGKFLYVDDLVTDSALRGLGVGQQLLEALMNEATLSGCDRLVLDTAITNIDAQRFYKRCGMSALATRFVQIVEAN